MTRLKPKNLNCLSLIINRQIDDNLAYFRANLFQERLAIAKNLYRTDLLAHYGCVNAIEFSNDGNLLVSGNKSY